MNQENLYFLETATEVVNSLIAMFVITEMRRKYDAITMGSVKGLFQYICPWIMANIIFRHVYFVRFFAAHTVDGFQYVLSPVAALAEMLGSCVIIYSVVLAVYLLWRYVSISNVEWSVAESRNHIFYVSAVSFAFFTFYLLGFDSIVSLSESLKITTLVVLFLLLLYIDVKRLREGLPLYLFGRALLESLWFSLLAVPLTAIAVSCAFLLIVSVLDKIGADPEHSEFMNRLVFYGTLYGPFYIVYWNAKQRLLKYPLLPVTAR